MLIYDKEESTILLATLHEKRWKNWPLNVSTAEPLVSPYERPKTTAKPAQPAPTAKGQGKSPEAYLTPIRFAQNARAVDGFNVRTHQSRHHRGGFFI